MSASCGDTEFLSIDDADDEGSLEAECSNCDVQFDVTFSVEVTVDEVQITGATAEGICPECYDSISQEVTSESGSEEIECDNDECGAHLEIELVRLGPGDGGSPHRQEGGFRRAGVRGRG
jgi:hypothetical protein